MDPADATSDTEISEAIEDLEKALADGPHVENHRLQELLKLWAVESFSQGTLISNGELAILIDNILREHLAKEKVTSALELSTAAKLQLSQAAAKCVGERLKTDIPNDLVSAEAERAAVYFGIKEAWVFRDWQAAIGEMVLESVQNAPRRFDVTGYGDFELRYLAVEEKNSDPDQRWFTRLKAVFIGLDVSKQGIFDARREQLKGTYEACKLLETALANRIDALRTENKKLKLARD